MIGVFVSVVKGVCLSEERRVKNPNANVVLAIIINKTNVPADLQLSCK